MKSTSKTTLSSGNKPSVVFFGSGPVAAKCLDLLAANFAIEAVITKASTLSQMHSVLPNVPIHTVNTSTALDELVESERFSSTVGLLIDFGIIVSQAVINSFELGIINSHFSLLPQWRGADPISFAILSGQKKTGVSLMLLDRQMDTGKIVVQKSLKLFGNETADILTTKLIDMSNRLLTKNIRRYLSGDIKPREQPHTDRALYSRKLAKLDGDLDFNKPAPVLEREIRAFQDWPKSRTTISGRDVVITAALIDPMKHSEKVGAIFTTSDKQIGIRCRVGSLLISELKPAGKPVMSATAFLAGHGSKL